MEFAVYVADAEPALIVLVPVTVIFPSMERVFFSPAERLPTDQVKFPPSMTEAPEFSNDISLGIGLVTSTSSIVTLETFSTSISRASGPPSGPLATDSERSCERAGLVSKCSRRISILIPSTLYFILYFFPASNSSTETWSPPMSVDSALSRITSIS